jgi:hypothetical protein
MCDVAIRLTMISILSCFKQLIVVCFGYISKLFRLDFYYESMIQFRLDFYLTQRGVPVVIEGFLVIMQKF